MNAIRCLCLILTMASVATAQAHFDDGKIVDWEVHNSTVPEHVESDARHNPDSTIESQLDSLIPHPYLLFGPTLGGGGYRPLALLLEGGIAVESQHWVLSARAAYDNDRKTNDADQPNPKGHDRYLDGGIYFRPEQLGGRWFFGGGYRWSQLSTTNYTKSGTRPQFGGGYDVVWRNCEVCRRDFSMRIAANYFTAGSDWQNGSHGVEVVATWPTPRENRHWFWEERVEIYRFYTTITDPQNITLTREQRSHKGMDSSDDFGIVYRF